MVRTYFKKKTLSTTALGLLFVATLSSQPVWSMDQKEDFNMTNQLAQKAQTAEEHLAVAKRYNARTTNTQKKAIPFFNKAIELYTEAANKNDSKALYKVAKFHQKGIAVGVTEVLSIDLGLAVELYNTIITLNKDNDIVKKALNQLKDLYLGKEVAVTEDGNTLYLLGKALKEIDFEINKDSIEEQRLKLFEEAEKYGSKEAKEELKN